MASDLTLDLRRLMVIDVELEVPLRLGHGPYGWRSVFKAKAGGSFEFDPGCDLSDIRGSLLAGPADYCLRDRSKNTRWLTADVRGVLLAKTPVRFAIYMHYTNCVPFSDADGDRLNSGGEIDFDESQFIVQPRFEVGDLDVDGDPLPSDTRDRIARLNATVAVAHAHLRPLGIKYEVYEIFNPSNPPPC